MLIIRFIVFFAITGMFSLFLVLPWRGQSGFESAKGAWQHREGSREDILSLADGYLVFVSFDKQTRHFFYTWGGPCTLEGNRLKVKMEFNTDSKDRVGSEAETEFTLGKDDLSTEFMDIKISWKRMDNGLAPLAGVWRITGRMQDEKIIEMPLRARRTYKILTASRFQWIAINTESGEFFGTGGGNYIFEKGKYTENIEFFSRDSTRVGSSLNFTDKLEEGNWHHSGLSSRGEKIFEIWGRYRVE